MTQEQERRVLFALGVFTLVTLALGIMALLYDICSPYNKYIMSCNCTKTMTMIQLCLRDRDENGIEND